MCATCKYISRYSNKVVIICQRRSPRMWQKEQRESAMALLTQVKIKLGSNSTDPPTAITSQWGGQTFLDHLKKCSYDAVEK